MRPLRVFWGAVLVSAALAAGFLVTSGSGQQPSSFAHVMDRRCRGGCTDTALLRVLPGGPTATQIAAGTLTGSKGQTITTTRASNKTCTRADGSVVFLGNNVPCVESAGVLLEPSHTNQALWSAGFDNVVWSKLASTSTTTVTADQATAPDGTLTADLAVFPTITGGGFATVQQTVNPVSAGQPYTMSVYAKTVSGTCTLPLGLAGSTQTTCSVNASTWTRCSVTANTISTSQDFQIGWNGSGTGGCSIYLWGADVEAGTGYSYVPTTTAAAIEPADVLTTAGGTLPSTFYTAGCVRATITPIWTGNAPVTKTAVGFSDGTHTGQAIFTQAGGSAVGANDGTTNTLILAYWPKNVAQAFTSEWSASQNLARVRLLPNATPTTSQASSAFTAFSGFVGGATGLYMEGFGGWVSDIQYGTGPAQCGTSFPPPYFIALGDSITSGQGIATVNLSFPARIAATKTKTYINAGISGEQTSTMATRWTQLASYSPSVLILMGGVNDLLNSVAVATVLANITAIHDDAHSKGMRTVMLTVTPCSGYVGPPACSAGVQANIQSLNTSLAAYAAAHPTNTTLVDTWTLLHNGAAVDTLLAANDSGDHLHPSQTGMDIIAAAVAAVMP